MTNVEKEIEKPTDSPQSSKETELSDLTDTSCEKKKDMHVLDQMGASNSDSLGPLTTNNKHCRRFILLTWMIYLLLNIVLVSLLVFIFMGKMFTPRHLMNNNKIVDQATVHEMAMNEVNNRQKRDNDTIYDLMNGMSKLNKTEEENHSRHRRHTGELYSTLQEFIEKCAKNTQINLENILDRRLRDFMEIGRNIMQDTSCKVAESIRVILSHFALPLLFVRSVGNVNWTTIHWDLFLSIFITKIFVFSLIILIGKLAYRSSLSSLTLYGILMTQTNDFSYGLSILENLTQSIPAEFLFIIGIISLIFINPFAFFSIEYSSNHHHNQITISPSSSSSFIEDIDSFENSSSGIESENELSPTSQIWEDVLKSTHLVLKNPLIFSGVIGLIYNLILSLLKMNHPAIYSNVVLMTDEPLKFGGMIFPSLALVFLGINFHQNRFRDDEKNQYLLITICLIVKCFLFPIIILLLYLTLSTTKHRFLSEYSVFYGNMTMNNYDDIIIRNNDTQRNYYNNLMYSLIYGTFPSAPTVQIYSVMFHNLIISIVVQSILFTTFLSTLNISLFSLFLHFDYSSLIQFFKYSSAISAILNVIYIIVNLFKLRRSIWNKYWDGNQHTNRMFMKMKFYHNIFIMTIHGLLNFIQYVLFFHVEKMNSINCSIYYLHLILFIVEEISNNQFELKYTQNEQNNPKFTIFTICQSVLTVGILFSIHKVFSQSTLVTWLPNPISNSFLFLLLAYWLYLNIRTFYTRISTTSSNITRRNVENCSTKFSFNFLLIFTIILINLTINIFQNTLPISINIMLNCFSLFQFHLLQNQYAIFIFFDR
ncbi:hypothetical protein SNEBB_010388 [Seison nebaliae]|nr:hypothetical protein SNEBB_010388 [Seison nebaliae]